MCANFAFCLKKKNFSLSDFEGKVIITSKRNQKGFWRLKKINIKLHPKIDNSNIRSRANQCYKIFKQFCTISESLKEEIEVNTDFDY